MSKLALLATGIAVVFALGLLACGGGGSDEKQAVNSTSDEELAIKSAVERLLTIEDAHLICQELLTKSLVIRIYGDTKQCLKAEQPESDDRPATGATTSDINVDGSSATVSVRVTGGSTDGTSGTLTLAKVAGDWRLDDYGVDLLRSATDATLDNSHSSSPAVKDPNLKSCVRDAYKHLSDPDFQRLAYKVMGETDGGMVTRQLVVPCMTKTDAGGVSYVRKAFEDGMAKAARERAPDVPASVVECVNQELRSTVTDDEISRLLLSGSKFKPTPAMEQNIRDAQASCGLDR